MAIAFLQVKTFKRADGQNAVAAAAYRAAEKITKASGEIEDYSRRKKPLASEIIVPNDCPTPPTREELWQAAEFAENRKDSRVAREILIALPREASEKTLIAMSRAITKMLVSREGFAADFSIHADDKGNPHVHILTTTRAWTKNGLAEKKLRHLDDKKQSGEHVEQWRKDWQLVCTKSGWPIDLRSYERQGREDIIPQEHVGKAAAAMAAKGIPTRKEERNNLVKGINEDIARANALIEKHEKETREKARAMTPGIREAAGLPRDEAEAVESISYPRVKIPNAAKRFSPTRKRRRRIRNQEPMPKTDKPTQKTPEQLANEALAILDKNKTKNQAPSPFENGPKPPG